MSNSLSDVFAVQRVLDREETSNMYNSIYFHSNERLKEIFSNVDVKDKDVLTVLASGDQAFYAYDNGAKSVDTFDINKLAIHYYYLRTWVIKYMNLFYPEDINNKFIKRIINLVEPCSAEEKSSLRFWRKYIKFFSDDDTYELFCFSDNPDINKINDISRIRKRIKSDKVNFYNVDISGKINIDKKYNIIFTSNIGDHIIHDEDTFKLYRDNLDGLLADDGKIVCSNVLRGRASILERRVFGDKFNSEDLPYIDDEYFTGAPGYVYTRK